MLIYRTHVAKCFAWITLVMDKGGRGISSIDRRKCEVLASWVNCFWFQVTSGSWALKLGPLTTEPCCNTGCKHD